MIKGAVAGTAGIALLAGGFSTYAVWTDRESVNAGKLQTGHLEIVSVGDETWTDKSSDRTTDTWLAGDKMVPGDVVELRQPLDVEAEGKNLKVAMTVEGIGVAGFDSWGDAGLNVTVNYGDKTATLGTSELVWAGEELQDLSDATDVIVTFSFDRDAVDNQRASIDLSGATVVVSQVRPTA